MRQIQKSLAALLLSCSITSALNGQALKDSLSFAINDTLAEWPHVALESNAKIFDRDECDYEPVAGGCPLAKFPKEAVERNLQGEVIVKILVTSRSEIKRVQIVKTPNKIFNRPSLEAALRGISFKAGIKDGKPVNAYTYFPIMYRLEQPK